MRELNVSEVNEVSGGNINGYEAAGAILAVLGSGAALAAGPLAAPVVGIALGAAAGLATAQAIADFF